MLKDSYITDGTGMAGDGSSLDRLRIELIDTLQHITIENGWTQTQAAKIMDISRSKLCKLFNGNFWVASEHKLLMCLLNAGYDIDIVIRRNTGSSGEVTIKKMSE